MKPRTRLEKLVAGLSEKLPAITKAQEEWAKEHVFDHVAYKCKNELWCSECGEIWVNTGNSKLGDNIECPYCPLKSCCAIAAAPQYRWECSL